MTDQDGFAKITVPVLKKFMQEEKARAKGDKVQTAQAKKLVTKGGKQELIQLIQEYFGIPSSADPQPESSFQVPAPSPSTVEVREHIP